MSREIYTYTDLTKLGESRLFQEIRYYPQVTVSADLRKGLVGTQARDYVNGIFAHDSRMRVTEFHSLAQAVYGDWGTDQGKFGEMILLSEYVRQKLNAAAGDKKQINWLVGCMRNLGSILSAIILLEQADVRPEHLESNGERNLELMLGAWKYLVEKDPVIQTFRKDCARHNTKETWEPILRKAFRTEASFATTEAIVFHGLYYITPLQEKIICSLEKAGYTHTGAHPRNFTVLDDWVLVACRDTDEIEIYSRDKKTGALKDTGRRIEVPKPVFVSDFSR